MKSFESLPVNPAQVAQLKRLVSQGEGSMLEFKRRATFPEKIIHEMIAFANTKGGVLLLGIGDDGSLAGLKYPEDERHVIQEALKKVRPALEYEETIIPISSARTVIRYDIHESKMKPHFILTPDNLKLAYVRVDDKSIKASRELKEIVRRKQRMKDVRFQYGEHEKFLMQYLQEKKVITLKEFVAVSGLKKFYASKKLVLLVVANVLRITPSEKGDLYSPVYR
jgi:predicted HTH transcriptional regulator